MQNKFKLFFLFNLLTCINSIGYSEPVLILDSGHDPFNKGAISFCGTPEFILNDNIVKSVVDESKGIILLTRNKGELSYKIVDDKYNYITALKARVDFSNSFENNGVFISIHHDSVSERFLEFSKNVCSGLGGKIISDSFKRKHNIGFNIFVYEETSVRFDKSMRLAKSISKKLLQLGRIPSNYHSPFSDDCQSCRPLDIDLGIWHQNLMVLRENKNPAVLIEVGNIKDPEDYKMITSEVFVKAFAILVNSAFEEYRQLEALGH